MRETESAAPAPGYVAGRAENGRFPDDHLARSIRPRNPQENPLRNWSL